MCVCVCVCLWFESTPVELALRGTPRLGVVVTPVSISKIIGGAEIFNTVMSIH